MLTNYSYRHLHLHIIASDIFSDRLKNKKHYNSFHPKRGFFLHLDDVLSWFDATPSYYKTVRIQVSHFFLLVTSDITLSRWLSYPNPNMNRS